LEGTMKRWYCRKKCLKLGDSYCLRIILTPVMR
jgi:hypothetical protein